MTPSHTDRSNAQTNGLITEQTFSATFHPHHLNALALLGLTPTAQVVHVVVESKYSPSLPARQGDFVVSIHSDKMNDRAVECKVRSRAHGWKRLMVFKRLAMALAEKSVTVTQFRVGVALVSVFRRNNHER